MQEDIYFFSSTPVLKGTFQSHVLSPLLVLKNNKCNIHLIVFESSAKEKDYISNLKKIINIEVICLNRSDTIFSHLKLLKIIFNNKIGRRSFVIHSQNYYCSYLSIKLKKYFFNLKVHADLKGLVPEEELFFSANNFIKRFFRYLVAKYFEVMILRKADSLGVVSHAFKDLLLQKYKTKKPIIVSPSVFDSTLFFQSSRIRKKIRNKLKIKNDEIVIVFSGGMQRWQNIEFFIQLIKQFNVNLFRFIIISDQNNKDVFKNGILKEKNALFFSGNQKMVNKILNASDYGFLVRNDHLVNRVSSPTKFSEYIATGNKVLISEHIGDFSDLVFHHNLGLVVTSELKKNTQDLEQLIIKDHKRKIPKNFLKKFSVEYSQTHNSNKLLRHYRKLIDEN